MASNKDIVQYKPLREEVQFAWNIAESRQAAKDPNFAINKKFNANRGDIETHYLGFLGELAAARYLGVRPDTRALHTGDGGVDLVYGGMTIDVKSRDRMRRDLAFYTDLSDLQADIAILAWVDIRDTIPVVHLPGWARRQRIEQEAQPMEFIPGHPRLVMRWTSLNPMDTL